MNKDFILDEYNNTVVIHNMDEFNKMRKAGNLASKVLDYIEPYIEEGISTNQKQDDHAAEDIVELLAESVLGPQN